MIVEIPSFERRRISGKSNLNVVRDGLRVLRTVRMEHRNGTKMTAKSAERPTSLTRRSVYSWRSRDRGDYVPDEVPATGHSLLDATDEFDAESLSVVICAYTTRRWFDLCRSVQSVLSQDGPDPELILVIDHCDELYIRACNRFRTDRG